MGMKLTIQEKVHNSRQRAIKRQLERKNLKKRLVGVRKGIRRVGKRGKINIQANKKLKAVYLMFHPHCEIRRKNCWHIFRGFAHRHKRRWYYGQEHLLARHNQTIMSCNQCHSEIEKDAKLTEEIFQKLRGNENNT